MFINLLGSEMNLDKSKYKYKAVIDFIEVEFKTVIPTNAFSIKRNARLTYVDPLDKGDGAAASHFRVKFHDITRWNEFEIMLNKLKSELQFEIEPFIYGVEVSLDAYSKNNDINDLIEHVVQFFWNHSNPVSNNRRIGKKGKGANAIESKEDLIRKIMKGGTIYIGSQKNGKGHKKDPISMRTYLKEIDKKTKLNLVQKRARTEITLVGAACPFSSIEEARKYNFSNLNKYFTFRNFKGNLNPLESIIVNARPVIAEKRRRRRIGGGTRENSRLTTADTKLNRIVYDRLRNLTRSLNT